MEGIADKLVIKDVISSGDGRSQKIEGSKNRRIGGFKESKRDEAQAERCDAGGPCVGGVWKVPDQVRRIALLVLDIVYLAVHRETSRTTVFTKYCEVPRECIDGDHPLQSSTEYFPSIALRTWCWSSFLYFAVSSTLHGTA